MKALQRWPDSMMPHDFKHLLSLTACLLGTFSADIDWDGVIEIANRTMTVTSLAAAVRSAEPSGIPEEVSNYLTVIGESNVKRNAMLRSQLDEAVACLNRSAIEPVITKGAATLVHQPRGYSDGRILVDLDLMVRPNAMHDAIGALSEIGYQVRIDGGAGTWPGDPGAHLPTMLDRVSDAGSIDLQCRPKGPAAFKDIEWLYSNSSQRRLGSGNAYLPSASAQIVSLILHDQFQDGDYWRGLIDLRHLLDIVHLSQISPLEIDWADIRSLFHAGYERHAVDTQLLTLSLLFGVPGVLPFKVGMLARLQWQRRKLQLGKSYLRPPLTAVTLLSEIASYSSWDRYGGQPHRSRRRQLTRIAREFRRYFRPVPLGKA